MSVHKDTKRGTWYVKFQNKTKRGFTKKSDAIAYEKGILSADGDLHEPKKDESSVSFKEIADMYLEECKNNTQYGTYNKNKTILEKYVLPIVKDAKIVDFDKTKCLEFKNHVISLHFSSAYKNYILSIYKAIFKYGCKYDFIGLDPSRVIGKIKKPYREKVEQKEKEMHIWSVDEFTKFIKMEDDTTFRILFIVLYFSGLRIGEAVSLQWKDYDGKSLSINKSLTRKTKAGSYEIKEPKSVSSNRIVPLNESVNSILHSYKQQIMEDPMYSDSWFMFGGNRPLAENTISRHKERAIKKANVKRIRLHDFRHSHASNLIADGVNIVAVSKRLGHRDISITLNTYTHLLEKNNEELLTKLEDSSKNLLTNLLTEPFHKV